jgi:hypothetical protein
MIPIYIYRDPRAAMLSAYEYGRRSVMLGKSNVFSRLDTLDKAASFIVPYLDIWDSWMNTELVLRVRYEDLLGDYDHEVSSLEDALRLEHDHPTNFEVREKYRPDKGSSGLSGTHFNVGDPERFRQVLKPDQLERINHQFEIRLNQMGYPI